MARIRRRIANPTRNLDTRSLERVREGALALRLASNPERLKIILRLGDGEQTVAELARDLGCSTAEAAMKLDPLRRAGLVKSAGKRFENCYDLTDIGFKTVRFVSQTFGPFHWIAPLSGKSEMNKVRLRETEYASQEEIDLKRRPNDKGLDPPAPDRRNGTL